MQKKILVVEDDPDFVELVEFNLKREGFSVGTVPIWKHFGANGPDPNH